MRRGDIQGASVHDDPLDDDEPSARPALRERVMGLDLGDKRIGVAVTDALGVGAHGRPTLVRRALADDLAELRARCEDEGIRRIVVGMPINMDGTEGPRVQKTRAFIDVLAAALADLAIPIETRDERLTSWEAERRLMEAGLDRKKRAAEVDRVAATIILQDWLDAQP